MKKRLLALLLCAATLLSLCTGFASAASSEEEALGAIDIFNGGTKMSYLSINGRVRELIYTYYNYVDSSGREKEIPAYCVNPNTVGVPQTVEPGESIEYLAEEIGTDPKAVGIVASGYPTRGLAELKLENKYLAYYATKMALWCYILPNWDINNLKVNPSLTGEELTRAQSILRAAKDIYTRGTRWNEVLAPTVTCTPDRDVAYPVTVNGRPYLQQVFTFWSKTWVCDYTVDVVFAMPEDVPEGTRIVDMNNQDITAITTSNTGDGYAGQFKVLYPAESVEGETGSVQLSFRTNVYKYAVFYAVCAEKGKYGELQNYLVDTDPTMEMRLSAMSSYANDEIIREDETSLRIVKLETGTELPLSGARFEVIDPKGATLGIFATNNNGEIYIPLTLEGNYTVIERDAPAFHLLAEHTAQNVDVEYGRTATVTFYNDPYGSLRIEKKSDTGMALPGAVITATHIESGKTYTAETNFAGCAIFSPVKPGAYRIQEQAAPSGWKLDDTVHTATVVSGETTTVPIIDQELPGLRIIKYDRKNQTAMPGVTFEIFRDAVSLGRFRTDEFGEILLTDVEPGTFRAVEVDTGGDGHILDTTPQEVELHAGDGIRELLFFNDVKPGLQLVKVDSTDPSKVIPDAVFEIKAVDGSYGPEEFRTSADGTIDLSKLPAGAYVVTEKSCAGYVIDDAQRIIQLDPNEDAQFVFTNTVKPSLRLLKLSSDGTPLGGVTFRIARISDGSRYLDRTTNAQGEILISDLEPGVYSVKETATNNSHILDLQEYHVELFPGQTSTLALENQKRPNLIVYKKDADTDAPIANTIFQVKAADGHSVDEIRTDAAGKATLSNLLPGVYEISEKSVPAPYLPDAEPQLVTLYPNRDHTVYFENHKKPTLTINKVDSITGSSPIKGAKFQVWYGSNSTTTGELNDLGVFYTNENGQIVIDQLRDGWYKVTELAPAPGFTIKEPATQEVYVKGGESKVLTFQNVPLNGIVVEKYDSVTHEALPGCTFQLRYLGGTSGTGGTVIGTKVTGKNGNAIWTGLKPGTYILEEVDPADGYSILQSSETILLADSGEQSVVTVRFQNSPDGILLIRKVCSVNPSVTLQNAEFKIAYADGTLIGDSNGIFRTDENGEIRITGLKPGKSVVVTETKAPSGFLIDTQSQTVQIQEGRTVSLTFKNQPKGAIILQKRGPDNEPLSGAEFRVTTAAGCEVGLDGVIGDSTLTQNGIFTTDAQGEIRISNLAPGAYVLTELKAPDGYVIDTPSTNVVIGPNGDTQTVIVKNSRAGSLLITKKDAVTGAPLSDVEFLVTDSDGQVIGNRNGKYVTDSAGTILIDQLTPGMTVIARETRSKENYVLDDTPQSIKIKANATVSLEFRNQPAGELVILKECSLTGKPLEGAIFKVTTATGAFVPDENGQVSSNGLYKTDKEGKITIKGVVGSLVVTETKSVPGYSIDPGSQTQTVVVHPNDVQTLRFYNTPSTTLIIEKYLGDPEDGNVPLKGVTFLVTDSSGAAVGNSNGEYVTDEAGRIVIEGLTPGITVTAREIKTVEGVVLDGAPKSILIKEGEAQYLRFYDQKAGTLVIRKLDKLTNKPLSGVEFQLTYATGEFVDADNGHLSSKGLYTTDANGEIRISGVTGTIVVKETKTLPGYTIDPATQTQTVTVNPEDTQTITVYNIPGNTLTIQKYIEGGNNEPLAGVTFLVTDSAGTPLGPNKGEYVTDRNGQIVLTGLVPGTTIIAKEVKTVEGYVLDGMPQSILIKDDGVAQQLTFWNKRDGGVEIYKVDEDDRGVRIPNTTMEIHRMDGGLVDTVTTDKRGRVHVNLDAGDYYLLETRAAEGYKLDTTPVYFTVKDNEATEVWVTNKAFSGVIIHKIDSVTGEGIYDVKFLLYDQNKNPIGEYATDNEGYIYIDDVTVAGKGRLYLRELEAAPGYELDKEYKTIYLQPGRTVEIEWENTPITGQLQVLKYAAEYNEVTGTPAGAPLQGAVYEISDPRTNKVVDYITTDARGVAASKPLPLGRYKIVEVTAPAYWQVDPIVFDETLEYSGQIIKVSAYDKPSNLGVTITKRGNAEALAGSQMRYDFTVANTSNVPLENFYWHERIPTDAARATVLTTGTYSARLNYRVLYKTNYTSDYQVLASNLLTSSSYSFSLNAIPTQAGEVVTDVYFDFGKVPVGFQSTASPTLTVVVSGTAANGYQLINRADVGGKYQGAWQTAQASWVTIVRKYGATPSLPKTGY